MRGLSRGLSKGARRLLGERGARGLWTGQEDMCQVNCGFEWKAGSESPLKLFPIAERFSLKLATYTSTFM